MPKPQIPIRWKNESQDDDERARRHGTTADPKIGHQRAVLEPLSWVRGDSPPGRDFGLRQSGGFYGQPLVVPTSRRSSPSRVRIREPREGTRIRTTAEEAPIPEEFIETRYPSHNVRYAPPPDRPRRRATAARPSAYFDDHPERIRERDILECVRAQENPHDRVVPPPLIRRSRAWMGRDTLDAIDGLDIPMDEDTTEEIENHVKRKVEHEFKRRIAAVKKGEEEDRMKLETLRLEVEETIRQKIGEAQQAAEEAKGKVADERARIEREVRGEIEAESRAATEAKAVEARRNDDFMKLTQEKLQQSIDEIVAMTRERLLKEVGPGKQTGSYAELNQFRDEIRAEIRAEILAEIRNEIRAEIRAEIWAVLKAEEALKGKTGRRESAERLSQRFQPSPPLGHPDRPSYSPAPGVAPPPVGRRHRRPPLFEAESRVPPGAPDTRKRDTHDGNFRRQRNLQRPDLFRPR